MNLKTDLHINECDYCNNSNVALTKVPKYKQYGVVCHWCGACGPQSTAAKWSQRTVKEARAEAIAKWNKTFEWRLFSQGTKSDD